MIQAVVYRFREFDEIVFGNIGKNRDPDLIFSEISVGIDVEKTKFSQMLRELFVGNRFIEIDRANGSGASLFVLDIPGEL